jgi:hypothetical protein
MSTPVTEGELLPFNGYTRGRRSSVVIYSKNIFPPPDSTWQAEHQIFIVIMINRLAFIFKYISIF